MEEPYKEMYIHLRKNMDMLERVCKRLSVKINDTLIESTDMYRAHLDEQMLDKEEFKKQFAELIETP